MGFFKKLFSAPPRILNAPVRAAEDVWGKVTKGKKPTENERFMSKPGDMIAKTIEDGVDYISNGPSKENIDED